MPRLHFACMAEARPDQSPVCLVQLEAAFSATSPISPGPAQGTSFSLFILGSFVACLLDDLALELWNDQVGPSVLQVGLF